MKVAPSRANTSQAAFVRKVLCYWRSCCGGVYRQRVAELQQPVLERSVCVLRLRYSLLRSPPRTQLYNVAVLNMVLGQNALAAEQLQHVYTVTKAPAVLPKLQAARSQANRQSFLGASATTAALTQAWARHLRHSHGHAAAACAAQICFLMA